MEKDSLGVTLILTNSTW